MNKDIYIFRQFIKIFMISAVLAVFSAFTALSSGYVPGFGSYVDSGPGAELKETSGGSDAQGT